MDVKYITDEVFNFLDRTALPRILDMFGSEAFAGEKQRLRTQEPNPHQWIERQAALQKEQNAQVADLTRSLLSASLPGILPEASLWFKGDGRPANELLWVVSPFEFALMAPATVSIALQQADDLLMGILCTVTETEVSITTGEKDDGSWTEDRKLTVNQHTLSSASANMQFMLTGNKLPENCSGRLLSLRKQYAISTMTNNRSENISHYMNSVANGSIDFCLGFNFSYHDIAAAICIVEQAGGIVTDFSGGRKKLYSGESFFCSNKAIHRQFMDLLSSS
ncbi:inositol monophosphatase family protein [Agriterribacter sp.]|uniref:inositol monophosphatase family protein n=1 Tax=Agriterribacter sp. TaxID=2821509 RepID=UPI002C496F11|nr:inositol monophosphatase family protein [Agriterribacter sp.]HRO46092.1 inositol monophosphatase family protein [Agriterribacter sp.]HRQ16152.1 inositol monophosphatase family protein [Agriterribacter sp.]